MARSFGQVKVEVWAPDSELRLLSPIAQWAFFMLISQPQVSNLGILAFTPQKWARFAFGMTAATVEDAIGELEQAGFVLVDRETGELLIRTFIRHDRVWLQPALVTNARVLIGQVESERLRGYLLAQHPWLDGDAWLTEAPVFANSKARWQEWDGPRIRMFEEARDSHPTVLEDPSQDPSLNSSPRPQDLVSGSGSGLSSRPTTKTLHVASYDGDEPDELAAADLEAPREGEIRQAVEAIPDSDPGGGSLGEIEPLARSIPASVFRATLERHRRRVANGGVSNQTGLLVDLLRKAARGFQLDLVRASAEAHGLTDPREEILSDARYYGSRDYLPWDAAEPLLRRKATRLGMPDVELAELLDLAFDAYTETAGQAPTERSAAA